MEKELMTNLQYKNHLKMILKILKKEKKKKAIKFIKSLLTEK